LWLTQENRAGNTEDLDIHLIVDNYVPPPCIPRWEPGWSGTPNFTCTLRQFRPHSLTWSNVFSRSEWPDCQRRLCFS